ncbi:MAG: glycosyltransferase family 2 protein [Lachnospiraceae bacterium]|nr:glycosyltransferase family 2 protein [Lachnospiraceae bacterium]
MDKKITVIVPVYNAERYLEKCIDSILVQDVPSMEILLLDDGATDSSGRICDAYAEKDERVRVIHKANEGLMATWMRGVRESDAPFLFFLDSDDWLEAGVIRKLHDALVEGKKQIVTGNILIDRLEKGQRMERLGIAPGIYEGETLQTQIKDEVLGHEVRRIPLSRCMKLFSRELIEDNLHLLQPQIRMGEDLNISVPAILDAERIVVLEGGPFYHYRYVAESMVHHYDTGLRENNRRLQEALTKVMEAKQIPHGKEMVEKEFLFFRLQAVKNELRNENAAEAIRNIREICEEEEEEKLLAKYDAPFENRTNRLIAPLLRHPGTMRIHFLRLLMRLKP